jgi:peptide/histidine transporter 3/4
MRYIFELINNTSHLFVGMNRGELECLVDSGTTHTILRNRQLFIELIAYNSSVTTMIGSSQVIKGRGTAKFLLPDGTTFKVTDALYAPRANRTLLSFKDIHAKRLSCRNTL